nr:MULTISPECIES: helix-turn-helix domain-containing protein [unclassified Mesorhizobium]
MAAGLPFLRQADRHRRIIYAATALFREAGYEGAKMEAIAAQDEVSIGTIYDYCQNKGDILGVGRRYDGRTGYW